MPRRAFLNYGKLAGIVILGVWLYGEWAVYWQAYRQWPVSQAPEVRILLVADPQIQGFRDEPAALAGVVTRWDSDRYLRQTLGWALFAYPVHAIVFLGDLIDEGSITDDATYDVYANRFHGIYPRDLAPVMVYLSGDNDIGGEGGDPVTAEKIARFRRHFPVQTMRSIPGTPFQVVSANVLSQKAPEFEALPAKDPEQFRLLISHFSLMPPTYSPYSQSVLKAVDPDVVFSAHYHFGLQDRYDKDSGRSLSNVTRRFTQAHDAPITINLQADRSSHVLEEIVVPTCSYRMGFKEMALGLVRFNGQTGDLVYHNLWLPGRFPILYLYAVTVPVCLVLCLLGRRNAGKSGKPRSRRSSFNSDYSKLV